MTWMIWPDNTALSAVALLFIAIPFLYAGRRPMHGLIRAASRAIGAPLRLGARWLDLTASSVRARNKVVLLAHGREEVVQTIEREFERVTALVQRDLHGYPVLQRKLLDEITRIEEDYKKCGEVPPPPPEWTKAVATIAKLRDSGDGLVPAILKDISGSVDKIYDKLTVEYRRAYEDRHHILKGFLPFWRSVDQTLGRVDRNLNGLQESAAKIDAQMDKYEKIQAGTVGVEQALTASAGTQFFTAAVVLLVAFGGAFVNFWLIARPMSAMVGGGEYLAGGIEAAHVAALVIIFIEATMGLFLMESLRITHLFPRINNMNDQMRRWMIRVSFTILLIFAGVEVALAVMRDFLVVADVELKRGLSGMAAAAPVSEGWVTHIPAGGQMVLGFILPFALAFVAIPLEYFIFSARTVLGVAVVGSIRAVGFVLRVLANIARHAGNLLVTLYDVVIFLPLALERLTREWRTGQRKEPLVDDHAPIPAEHNKLRKAG